MTMKKYLSIVGVTLLIVFSTLFVINYFTCFGYYLPHKAHVIFMKPNDISAHAYPMYLPLEEPPSPTINLINK